MISDMYESTKCE